MEIVLKPTIKQYQAYQYLRDNITKYILYGGAAGGGKTWLAVEWLVCNCYLYPDTRWFIGREELSRLKESDLVTFFKIVSHYKIPNTDFKYNGQNHYIQFSNSSRISLLDLKYLPSDPLYERFGSVEYTGGVIDEGGEVNFGAFDVLKTRVGRYNNDKYNILAKILITANPKKNWLYTTFYKPYREGKLPKEFVFIQAFVSDNKYIDKQYIENLLTITCKQIKDRLLLGNWEYADEDNKLMQFEKITNLFTNNFVSGGVKYITADVARFGKDKTIIMLWDGFRVERIIVMLKSSIPDTAQKIKEIATENKVPMSNVVVDEDGVGGGVVDILHCKGFVNNSQPVKRGGGKKDNYKNLRSQCYFILAEDFVNKDLIYIYTESSSIKTQITEELEVLQRCNPDSDQKLAVIPRETIVQLLGRSPDFASTIMMRMFGVLKPSLIVK